MKEFYKFNGCIYEEAYQDQSSRAQKCKGCIDAHLDLLLPEEVLFCIGQGVVDADTCSNLDTEELCKDEKADECGWISGKCYSMSEELTYDAYKEILRGIDDHEMCRRLGGYIRKGSTCVGRQKNNVRCTAINKFGRKRTQCDDCENFCGWLDGCEYKSNKHTCSGKKPFLED